MRISDWSSDVCSSDLFNLDAFQHLFSANAVMGPFSRPSVSQSYVMKCSDGKWIALHLSSPPKFWPGLAAAMEKLALFDAERFATRAAIGRASCRVRVCQYV